MFAACLWFAACSLSPHPAETSGGAEEGWITQGAAQRNGLFWELLAAVKCKKPIVYLTVTLNS